MDRIIFAFTRLWRYLNLYFLKPFDAVNDTLTASLVSRFDWAGDFVELGSGDGEYIYVMHGGKFPLWFDRYLLTDLAKKDIYDTHESNVLKSTKKLNSPNILLAIDAKETHVKKIHEIGFARNAVVAEYEFLPIGDATVQKIFYYTPHGLKDHNRAIKEAYRILKKNGTLLILLYDTAFCGSFLCFNLSRKVRNNKMRRYFSKLDNGRYDEITNLAKSESEWEDFFIEKGFKTIRNHTGLSTIAWKVYDTQTRPFLKPLVRFFNFFSLPIRTFLKLSWMICWYPFLILFYILFANDFFPFSKKNCYFAFELEKVN
ncbi:MAG TPA: methyltransferase domain-containing protein [bacterium]|nr:methyltransferase domain-containing protein [bacterium]